MAYAAGAGRRLARLKKNSSVELILRRNLAGLIVSSSVSLMLRLSLCSVVLETNSISLDRPKVETSKILPLPEKNLRFSARRFELSVCLRLRLEGTSHSLLLSKIRRLRGLWAGRWSISG